MYFLNRVLLYSLALTAPILSFANTPGIFGDFYGSINHKNLNYDQLVKLSLIPNRAEGNELKLKSIITLYFGSPEDGEYVSYHYDDVTYSLLTGELTFTQNDQDISLFNVKINAEGFDSQVSSNLIGNVGTLKLYKDPKKVKITKLYPNVGGEFIGTCDSEKVKLQLFTFRSTDDSSRLGNPFGANRIVGQIAKIEPELCIFNKKEYCVQSRFDSASFDYYTGKLSLVGLPENLECEITENGWKCGNSACELTNVKVRKLKSDYFEKLFQAREFFASDSQSDIGSGALGGAYTGYLHHENLNQFQPVSLDIKAIQIPSTGGNQLGLIATARSSFGKTPSNYETITYRFDAAKILNPIQPFPIVLGNPEEDVDAILKINSISNGVVKGTWYSILFGRVGTFEMRKTGVVALPTNASFIAPLSGEYIQGSRGEKDFLVNMKVTQGRGPLNSDNPFYPLAINGYVWTKSHTLKKLPIVEGSYDFYTGRLGFVFGEGDELRNYIGQMNGTNELPIFKRMGGGFGTVMQSFYDEQYLRK